MGRSVFVLLPNSLCAGEPELSSNGVFLRASSADRGLIILLSCMCLYEKIFLLFGQLFRLRHWIGVVRAAGNVGELVCISKFPELLA